MCRRFKKNRLIIVLFLFVTLIFCFISSYGTDNIIVGRILTNESRAAETQDSSYKKDYSVNNGLNFLGPVTMEVSNIELLRFLKTYSEIYDFSFFIDRRIDPATKLSGSFISTPLVTVLDEIFTKAGLSFCIVNNVLLYVGPCGAAGEALALFSIKSQQMKKKAPRIVAEKLNSKIDFEIEEYACPSDIFYALGKRARLKFSGYEKTPFDRWRGGSYSRVVVSDMLILMSLGFNVDYCYDPDSATIKPCSLDRDQKVSRHYTRVYAVQLDQSKYPRCVFSENTFEGEPVISVIGSFRDVARVEYDYSTIRRKAWSEEMKITLDIGNIPRSERVPNSNKSSRTHVEVTGAIANQSLENLFEYLKNTAKIRCVLDPSIQAVGITLDTRISCEFRHSNTKEIARIIANKIGAKTIVEGSKITFTK